MTLIILTILGIAVTVLMVVLATTEPAMWLFNEAYMFIMHTWKGSFDDVPRPDRTSHRLGQREDQYYVRQRQYVRMTIHLRHTDELQWRAHA